MSLKPGEALHRPLHPRGPDATAGTPRLPTDGRIHNPNGAPPPAAMFVLNIPVRGRRHLGILKGKKQADACLRVHVGTLMRAR